MIKSNLPFSAFGIVCVAGSLGLISLTGSARAAITVYPTPGIENPVTYTFTATGTGPITAYFVGGTASFGSVVGLSINGAAPLSFGLQNHNSAQGQSFAMGNVTAGDTLRFVLDVSQTDGNGPPPSTYLLNSDPSLNPAGENHVYSYAYAGGDFGIPAGTYVGFEDISPLADGDTDYDDHQFVFVGVRATPRDTVPEGGLTFTLLGMALAGIGFLRRKLG